MSSSTYDEPLLDITLILKTLWQKKYVIIIWIIVFVSCAIVYIVFSRPVFISSAVILVDPREAKATKSENVLEGIGSDSAAIASQVAVIQSSTLLKAVFEQHNIASDPEFNTKGGLRSKLMGLVKKPGPVSPELKKRQAFEAFRKNISIYREGLTYVLNISFKSADPDKAAQVANSIVKNYISGQVSERSDANREVNVLLASRIANLRESVNNAEKAIEDFKVENNIINIRTGQTMLNARFEQLNNQWQTAKVISREKINRYNQARKLDGSAPGSIKMSELLTSASARQLRATYNTRLVSLIKAKEILGARHPSRIALEVEVSHLGKMMKTEAKRIVSSLRASKELARTNVDTIKLKLTLLRKNLEKFNQTSIRLRQLERTADASRNILEQFLARSKETNQLGLLQRSNIRVLSSATPSLSPSWPKPFLTLLVAAFLGVLSGGLLALSSRKPSA